MSVLAGISVARLPTLVFGLVIASEALFALMVVVGSMNILRMAGITLILSLERVLGWSDRLANGVGMAAGIGGMAVITMAIV